MRLALVQQHAVADKADNVWRGQAMERAARDGATVVALAELAFEPFHLSRVPRLEDSILIADIDFQLVKSSHADRLFLQHRRPALYAEWFAES